MGTEPDVVIRVEHLSKSFDGPVVLDDVHLTVERSKIVVMIGQSGCGKTTLLRCINLLERPDKGKIEVAGKPTCVNGKIVYGDLAALRRRVGMVFQRFNLFPHLTAVENVMLAQIESGVAEGEAMERAVAELRSVRLIHRATAYPEQMSGGEQQRVAIARALALRPQVLLFDEPTSSLDPESTGEVLRVMRELADSGMTMVVVTHELPFARDLADSVVFLDGGKIIEEGHPKDVIGRPQHKRTREFLTNYAAGLQEHAEPRPGKQAQGADAAVKDSVLPPL
ncbi:MAG TPA: amino acid ABC transporter ATP-binding protein [Euzebya sp.]|nr:amino acid ABC transporter ATP-binding protein [Euzebya sp.]